MLSTLMEKQSETIAMDAVAALLQLVQDDGAFERVVAVTLDTRGQPSVVLAMPELDDGLPRTWLPVLSAAGPSVPRQGDEPDNRAIQVVLSEPAIGSLVVVSSAVQGESGRVLLCGWRPGADPISEALLTRLARLTPIMAMAIAGDRLHRLRRASFHVLLEHLRESFAVLGPDHTLVFESPAASRMLGYAPGARDSFTDDQLMSLIHPDDRPEVTALVSRLMEDPNSPHTAEFRARHADGSWRWLSVQATNLTDDPMIGGFIYSTVDITERKAYQSRLEYEASHDFLTGIANRAELERILDEHIATNTPVSLLYVDLDGFHGINGAYGHAVGDGVLQEIARRLDRRREPGELVSRFGGDEFLILVPTGSADAAQRRAQAFLSCFRDDCPVGERLIPVRASIGVARFPDDGYSLGTLYRAADRALYRIKGTVPGRIAIFDEHLDGAGVITDRLAQEFVTAAEAGDLRLHFQPIRDLATHEIWGYEGLIRWHHPELGLLTPKEIMPVVDEFGYGDLLAKICVHGAIEGIQRLNTPVAFNLSPGQLHYPELAMEITRAIQEHGIDPGQLILEVTEGAAIVSHEEGLLTLRELHHIGIRIAIDDFGTGYSDLAALRSYPIDILKIDRSFIAALDGHEADYALVTAILAIAQALDCEVVAEGLESSRQRDVITMLGCRYGQGYLLGFPQPVEALAEVEGGHTAPQEAPKEGPLDRLLER